MKIRIGNKLMFTIGLSLILGAQLFTKSTLAYFLGIACLISILTNLEGNKDE
tara:strand:- start:2321 stop:2476 length:156 start_codon:yes stop_codon:yes gene_type:complete